MRSLGTHAWVFPTIPAVLNVPLSMLPLLGGYRDLESPGAMAQAVPPSTPLATTNFLNFIAVVIGLQGLFLSALIIGVAVTSYRKGNNPLAWYVMLWFFAYLLVSAAQAVFQPLPGGISQTGDLLFFIFPGLAAIGLLLSYGRYFPGN